MNLTVHLRGGLTLRDPFMIASSHWTAGEQTFKQLAQVSPAAVTLKTTSAKFGAAGTTDEAIANRNKHILIDHSGCEANTMFTDGPKPLELWDVLTTSEMLPLANKILPDSLIGLSILQGEDYHTIRDKLAHLRADNYDYIELNWKYTFREESLNVSDSAHYEKDLDRAFLRIYDDTSGFVDAFSHRPRIVKFSRESLLFLSHPNFLRIFEILAKSNTNLIIANSLRTKVPPSRVKDRSKKGTHELVKGVVVGEHLFLQTYDAIRDLCLGANQDLVSGAVIGSGGVMDVSGTVDLLGAGASAVQLCTILDIRTVHVLQWLRDELSAAVAQFGSLSEARDAIRTSDASWIEVLDNSQSVSKDVGSRIDNILYSTDSQVIPLAADTIKLETQRQEGSHVPSSSEERMPPKSELAGASFIVGRGNLSSFILSSRAVSRFGLTALPLETSGQLLTKLRSPEFSYDFCILARSSLTIILKQPAALLKDRIPEEVGPVASSVVELVGSDEASLETIQRVYHFGGPTARAAVDKLADNPNVRFEPLEISHSQLLPLLRYWPKEHAILAKPPLSRLYGLLTAQPDKWRAIWSCAEDLVLAASEAAKSRLGEDAIQYLLEFFQAERESVSLNSEEAAREACDVDTIRYLARLLGRRELEGIVVLGT